MTPLSPAQLSLQLELLLAERDMQIAQLRGQLVIEKLRGVCGASADAVFNERTRSFEEPVAPASEPPAQEVS